MAGPHLAAQQPPKLPRSFIHRTKAPRPHHLRIAILFLFTTNPPFLRGEDHFLRHPWLKRLREATSRPPLGSVTACGARPGPAPPGIPITQAFCSSRSPFVKAGPGTMRPPGAVICPGEPAQHI